MAFVLADRVKDSTTSTGTGTITLAGTPPQGFQSFTAIGNANTTYYTIVGGAEWEVGIGTYTSAGTTLSRDTVLSSSNAGSLVSFSAGTKEVFVTYPSGKAVVGNYGTVTASTPILDLSQTWNNAAVAFTGIKSNITDTASLTASYLMDLQVGGVSKVYAGKDGTISAQGTIVSASHLRATGGGSVQINSNTGALNFGSTADVFLYRDAANTLAQRNGTAAQAFNIYNTYTDASNYERLNISANGTYYQIANQAQGTGTSRQIRLGVWYFENNGSFVNATDNTYDIGASGANRPRNVYVGGLGVFGGVVSASSFSSATAGYIGWAGGKSYFTSGADGAVTISNSVGTNTVTLTVGASNLLTLDGGLTLGSANGLTFSARSVIRSPGDSVITLLNNAGTDFGRLQFGGTTSSFPALARAGGQLQTVLADFSAYASHRASAFVANNGTRYTDSADGVALLLNGPSTDFGRLCFGGVTSSFPALKRSGTELQARLADDTGYAGVFSSYLKLNGNGVLSTTADGVWMVQNAAQTDFSRLMFGGTTNAYPALKRSGAGFDVRLADDSGTATMRMGATIYGSGSRISDNADGVLLFQDSASATFNRIMLGGTTSAFPAIKRNGTGVETRLADDSAYTYLRTSSAFLLNNSRVTDTAEGIIQLSNAAATDFTRLNFGGTTSSFPALARNTSALEVKLADNSGYADLNARRITGLGTATMPAAIFTNTVEKFTASATVATGTINLDAATQSCLYYTSNASANWTVNLRLSSTGSMNSALAIGESMTFVFAVTQGATAYYNNVVQVDATTSGVTTKWLGGAPVGGNASGIDVYTYCVAKTAAATFTVFASVAQFK